MMMYDEAAAKAHAAALSLWDAALGTFCFDDREIEEDDEVFVFAVGPREDIVEGDPDFVRDGASVPLVYKETGQLDWLPQSVIYATHLDLRIRTNPSPVFFE